ncbi:LytTR family two component transcriptional regulator [Pedobacter psychrotolerans]|uniref:DNA-binding response regulator n=1 Tax=Pedobacter psychrotolerans TaxID=1843235 RepID=A0A4R2HEL2_9SPHI|nr:LytTR family DNA-binding domain-containing protein [Pedobacter psychrotolerans]TCO26700.1 LytTR family two component transcriptional regulator [Pedobacter psychrotolerans]GGE55821.1 DNA-binding response regulator [Pedobacter psychrotolerans]
MRAILVDDEPANLENLQILLTKNCPQVKVVAVANNIHDAFEEINLHLPDLLFLDIQMGKTTGFDLLSLLTENTFEVIFVTAFDNYGIQAVKFAALDYLLKPVDLDELKIAVSKAEGRIKRKINGDQLNFLIHQIKRTEPNILKIALPQQHEIRYVSVNDIVRCVADNTYTFFYLFDGEKILISKPLKEYSDLLKPQGFVRAHQSHLVNPKFVKSWLKEDGGTLLMKNGDKIPVSKPNRDIVKAALGK